MSSPPLFPNTFLRLLDPPCSPTPLGLFWVRVANNTQPCSRGPLPRHITLLEGGPHALCERTQVDTHAAMIRCRRRRVRGELNLRLWLIRRLDLSANGRG